MLAHRDRVHPRDLTDDERAVLQTRETERARANVRRALQVSRPTAPTLGKAEARAPGDERDSPLAGVAPGGPADWLLRPSERRLTPPDVPVSLWAEIQEADRLLHARCGERLTGDEEEDAQALLADLCHDAWAEMAEADDTLTGAREHLYEADRPKFHKKYGEGLEERKEALTEPLTVLREAGERGIPHLAMVMTTDTWASILAVDALEGMPSGPRRDRALVEALFLSGDWVPEAGERAALTMAPERRWPLFERVATAAQEEAIELQSLYWTALFERGPDDPSERRPTPDMGRAALLLYDLGHHSALVAGLGFLLDPMVSGPERSERNLREGGLAETMKALAQRPPQRRPNRPLVEP